MPPTKNKVGRPPKNAQGSVVPFQSNIIIDDFFQALMDSEIPPSEKAYMVNIDHAMNQRAMEKRTLSELLTAFDAEYKAKKKEQKAKLESSEAFTILQQTKADIERADVEFAALTEKIFGYMELLRGRYLAGEHIPENVQKLLIG